MVPDHQKALAGRDDATPLQRLFFLWALPVIRRAQDLGSDLSVHDLPHLRESSDPRLLHEQLGAEWDAEVARAASRKRAPSILRALWRFYADVRPIFFFGSAAVACCQLSLPQLARQLIIGIEEDAPVWRGLCFICWHVASMRAVDSWLALTSLIYCKPTRLSRAALSQYPEGKLANLISQDAQGFLEVSQFFFFWSMVPFMHSIS